ncbi:MAG: hypothetical protein KAI17_22350 [Thiotrichaceae bacterium]|nr:hypothetical protein [Thiotrichaceae bacterium]
MLKQQRKYFGAFLLLLFSANVWSQESTLQCSNGAFLDSYFLIEVEDIAGVSTFFQQIPAQFFTENDELFAITVGSKDRVETYFDDTSSTLLKNDQELILNLHTNLPVYRLDREHVDLNSSAPGSIRNDIFEVKNYNKKVTALDKHELFGRVKRNQRPLLIDKLKVFVNDPVVDIEKRLQVEHEEVVQLYSHYGEGYGEITWDKFYVSNFGLSKTYSLFKLQIYSDLSSQLSQSENKYLNQYFCNTYAEFINRFPHIPVYHQFGYNHYHFLAELLFPLKSFFEKYPALFSLGQIVILIMVGFLFMYLFIGRYTKGQHFRQVVVNKYQKRDEN